jgi:hypothetical protein
MKNRQAILVLEKAKVLFKENIKKRIQQNHKKKKKNVKTEFERVISPENSESGFWRLEQSKFQLKTFFKTNEYEDK